MVEVAQPGDRSQEARLERAATTALDATAAAAAAIETDGHLLLQSRAGGDSLPPSGLADEAEVGWRLVPHSDQPITVSRGQVTVA